MKRLLGAGIAVIALTGVTGLQTADAGLFDKLKKKAEDAVNDFVEDETNGAAPEEAETPTAGGASPSSSKSADAGATTGGDLPTAPLKIGKAVLAAAPDLFDGRPDEQLSDRYMKDFTRLFFPERDEDIRNEFRWRKNKDAWQAEMVALSKGAPTSFDVAPWLNNGSEKKDSSEDVRPKFAISKYDFDKGAWQFGTTNGIPVPWYAPAKYSFVPYEITGFDRDNMENRYLPMSADAAEKFDEMLNEYGRTLYGKYRFTITDVVVDPEKNPRYKQYERDISKLPEDRANAMIAESLPPMAQVEIVDNRVDLYVGKGHGNSTDRDDYRLVGTLDIGTGEVTAAKP